MNHRSPSSATQAAHAQHILLLGASGVSGLAFINHHLSLPSTSTKPYLTLYIRASARSKLPPAALSSSAAAAHIRIVEGGLTDLVALRHALAASSESNVPFPPVTTVISLLGAYMSPYYFLTRLKPTPIADAFRTVIVPAIRDAGVKRVMMLSTPTAYPVADEGKRMSWSWWLMGWMPVIVVPQGNAEMKGLADAVTGKDAEGLDVTVFRVPILTDGETGRGVVAGFLGHEGFTEKKTLAREEMVKWLLQELEGKEWIAKAPVLCDR